MQGMQIVYELPNESQSIVSYRPQRLTVTQGEFFDDDDGSSMSKKSKTSSNSSGLSKKSKKSANKRKNHFVLPEPP